MDRGRATSKEEGRSGTMRAYDAGRGLVTAVALAAGALGCASGGAQSRAPVVAAAPPRDDGLPSEGGSGGNAHSAALEQLKAAPLRPRSDRQGSMSVLLPDAENWTLVKFWGVPSLVGFRYGKDHHAIVAAFVTHVDDNTAPGACTKSFEAWAKPWVDAFEVDVAHEAPRAVPWNGAVADIDVVFAKTATIAQRDAYAVTYGVYPVWGNACLVVGAAVPSRDDDARAKQVRDRFAAEVLPRVQVTAPAEPKARY